MKFSIRDLLLVTVIVALAMAWGLDHWRQARIAKALTESEQSAERRYTALLTLMTIDGAAVVWETSANGRIEMTLVYPKDRAMPNPSAADLDLVKAQVLESLSVPDDTEGPVRGYNLLGPTSTRPKPPQE